MRHVTVTRNGGSTEREEPREKKRRGGVKLATKEKEKGRSKTRDQKKWSRRDAKKQRKGGSGRTEGKDQKREESEIKSVKVCGCCPQSELWQDGS